MAEIRYQNFDLTIQREGKGYKIRVDSPAGEATGRFRVPFSALELENFYLNSTPGKRSVRRIDTPEVASAKKYGERLFKAVFSEEILGRLQTALGDADRSDERLRIRLRLTGVPELTDLPWDYLYNPALNRFLALGSDTALVRYLELPERVRPVTVQLPLKMLVVISSPNDFPRLDVEQEWANLNEALKELIDQEMITVDLLEDATMPELRRRLSKEQYNILHFIGHGAFDRQTEEGVVVFKDENGRGRLVSGQQLGVITHNHKSLALAVLNACEGAKGDASDVFAGTAQSLVQQGIPAVVAMQREITDDAAKVFAHAFYSAVAAGNPVEAAMTETRIALYAEELGLEWATPVLYMRAQDGRVFDLQEPVARSVQTVKPVEPATPIAAPPVIPKGVAAPLTEMEDEQQKKPEAEQLAPASRKQPLPPPASGDEIAKQIMASTDELVRSYTASSTPKPEALVGQGLAQTIDKAIRDEQNKGAQRSGKRSNTGLMAVGVVGLIAIIVAVVFLVSSNGNGSNNNNKGNNGLSVEPTITIDPNLPVEIQDVLATRTAAVVQGVTPDPLVFEKRQEMLFSNPLPAGSEADAAVYSPDDAYFAVWFYVGDTSDGLNQGKILVWAADAAQPMVEFDVFGYDRSYAQMVFFPPDGDDNANRRFAYIEANKDIRVRRLNDPSFTSDIHMEETFSIAVSHDGAYLATGLRNGDTVVWNTATGEKKLRIHGNSGLVGHVAFSPYSYVLASTDASNTRVSGSEVATSLYDAAHDLGNTELPTRLFYTHDGTFFVVCSSYANCEFYSASNGETIGKLLLTGLDKSNVGMMLAASMTADDSKFVTGWQNGNVTYWDESGLPKNYEAVVDGVNTRAMAFAPSMYTMVLVTADNKVQVWGLPNQ